MKKNALFILPLTHFSAEFGYPKIRFSTDFEYPKIQFSAEFGYPKILFWVPDPSLYACIVRYIQVEDDNNSSIRPLNDKMLNFWAGQFCILKVKLPMN